MSVHEKLAVLCDKISKKYWDIYHSLGATDPDDRRLRNICYGRAHGAGECARAIRAEINGEFSGLAHEACGIIPKLGERFIHWKKGDIVEVTKVSRAEWVNGPPWQVMVTYKHVDAKPDDLDWTRTIDDFFAIVETETGTRVLRFRRVS